MHPESTRKRSSSIVGRFRPLRSARAAKAAAGLLLALLALLTAGCGLFENINQSVQYVNTTSGYIETTGAFLQEASTLAEQAVQSDEAREQLLLALEAMASRILEFGELQPPEIAGTLHRELLGYNEALREKVADYKALLEQGGSWGLERWNESGIADAVKPITELLIKLRDL